LIPSKNRTLEPKMTLASRVPNWVDLLLLKTYDVIV